MARKIPIFLKPLPRMSGNEFRWTPRAQRGAGPPSYYAGDAGIRHAHPARVLWFYSSFAISLRA